MVREVGEKDDGHARVKDFRVEHWFDEVTYWNHAVAMDERSDWFPKVLDWQRTARTVRTQHSCWARLWPRLTSAAACRCTQA